jgi:Ca-activated chloride channel homolog
MQRLTRRRGLLALAAVWILGTATLFGLPTAGSLNPANRVVVTHWAAGHLMPEHLLPEFAREFNADRRTILSGKRIEVRVVGLDSYVQTERLVESARAGRVVDASAGEPTIATPTVDHWLAEVNHRVGRTVVDLSQTDELAVSWTGIATYREMAQCLGWPNREIGYADIVALRTDPRGWAPARPPARPGDSSR